MRLSSSLSSHDDELRASTDKDYTFRARSHEEMLQWHAAIEKLAGNAITVDANTPTSTKHKGIVPETVATAGLPGSAVATEAASTTTAGTAEEEDSSSGEEEEEDEPAFEDAPASTQLHETTAPAHLTTIEGTTVDKSVANAHGAGESEQLPGYQSGGVEAPLEKKVAFEGGSGLPAPIAGNGHADASMASGSKALVSDGHPEGVHSTPQAGASFTVLCTLEHC